MLTSLTHTHNSSQRRPQSLNIYGRKLKSPETSQMVRHNYKSHKNCTNHPNAELMVTIKNSVANATTSCYYYHYYWVALTWPGLAWAGVSWPGWAELA